MQAMTNSRESLRDLVGRIAGTFQRLDAGDRATLRRTRGDPQREAAFWRVAFSAGLPTDEHGDIRQAERWAEVLRALAIIGEHKPGARLGRVLAKPTGTEVSFSQLRFERLLRASFDRLPDEIRLVARFLASKEAPVDVTDLARLLILDPESEDGRLCRRHIASDYYRTVPRLDDES